MKDTSASAPNSAFRALMAAVDFSGLRFNITTRAPLDRNTRVASKPALRTLTRGNHCACLVEAVGDVPTAQTLGTLARKVLSSSRHIESRELARAVLRLLARSKKQS